MFVMKRRAVLAMLAAAPVVALTKREPTEPLWRFPEGDVRWKVTDWYVDPTNTSISRDVT